MGTTAAWRRVMTLGANHTTSARHVVVVGFRAAAHRAAMVLPWGLSGGSATGRCLGDAYLRLAEGFGARNVAGTAGAGSVVGLAIGSAGAVLLII